MTTLFDDLPLPGLDGARLPAAVPPRPDHESPDDAPGDRQGTTAAERRAEAEARAEALLVGLNPEQRAAVLHTGSPLLIVAGAGSGKTRVLTHRIAHQLATGRVRPSEVLAITFTNKAAAEMRERVATLVGPAARSMWVSTFHSACVRILRREAATLGLRSSFSIYDSADSQRLLTLVGRELDLDPKKFPAKAMASKISNLKDELVDPETYARTSGASSGAANAFDEALSAVYTRYQARLRQAHALDFDDLIMTTVNLLQAFPAVAEHYRRRFRQILVDEYQDTNHAQYVLVRELTRAHVPAGARGTAAHDDTHDAAHDDDAAQGAPPGPGPAELTVVGDADQSIYAFRGATIRNILEFEVDYPDARTILLEQNYRSTQTILSAANAVISRNTGRTAKRLWTDAGAGPQIVGYVADNEHEEARFVAEEIDRLADAEGVRPGDVAIFYRANAQSRALEEVLIRVGLPYKVVGGTRFYERREVKDAVAYLRAIANPDDDVNLRRVLNVPKRGLGDRSEAMLAAFAERERISFGAALERVEEAPGLGTRAVVGLRAFAEMMAGLRELAASGAGPGEVLGEVLDRTGYLAELRRSEDPQDASRVENLAELHAVATEFEQSEPDGDLADFLERVSLVADSDQIPSQDVAEGEAPRPDQGVVTLMTLHTAKGLEFPVVFVTGWEDGTFPHMRSLADPDQLAEERRLAYVGLTRARQRLYISRAAVRTAWGVPNEFPASRFLDDVPPELVDWRRAESSMAVLRAGGSGWGGGASAWGGRGGSGSGGSGYGGPGASGARSGPVTTRRAAGASGTGSRGTTTPSTGATFGSATPRPADQVPSLALGDRVTHDAYGLGTVVGVEGTGPNAVAKIDFGASGTKRLLLRYSPVTRL
ncbi:UvrD-helicase domain-containing protein [Actinotalea sp.]|uniref:UvrD-helicase domain-containing protein n=1 Tax=Actinotalea sp. TaxID=1872145 RepID=UPI002CE48784|nr:UvrD-helicase domain-containing protein [Actinotalea sp.]HQY33928.1 UvrD-helicase domain-containing protein [Actinotalea sp.]HRA50595.1 UvrD-helicase domain-containing protein [Actinotalea sp.]